MTLHRRRKNSTSCFQCDMDIAHVCYAGQPGARWGWTDEAVATLEAAQRLLSRPVAPLPTARARSWAADTAHFLKIKTEDPVRKLTADEAAKMPVQERCLRILVEFDEWLAARTLQYGLKYEDLPQLNDAFRGYFANTRTVQGSGGPSCA